MARRKESDPYLRSIGDIKPPIGMSRLDAALKSPGPSIIRTYETTKDKEQRDFPKSSDLLLAKGAACGLDESGHCVHFWPEKGLSFVGLLDGQNEDWAVVKTRGSVVLKIAGLKDSDRGKPVFCTGPDSFTTERPPGAAEIGKIRYVQEGRAAVAFKSERDNRPVSLDIK